MFPPTMKTPVLLTACFAAALGARAAVVTKTVAYEQGGVKLQSVLVYDDQVTLQRPGVLVFPEWWGLNDYVKGRARQLAELGYVALAVDMYGGGRATTDPKVAGALAGQFYGKPLMAERAQAALDQLLRTGLVDDKRVAAIGFCFGGAVAQTLAYSGAPLVGIVSFHGSLVPATPEAAKRNHARFLICHGALDPFTSPAALDAFKQSLDAAKIDYQLVIYSGAKHAFTNPEADAIAAATGLSGIGYNAAAARRSWALMQSFFGEIFAPQ
jgi:dienelactone hydrolase